VPKQFLKLKVCLVHFPMNLLNTLRVILDVKTAIMIDCVKRQWHWQLVWDVILNYAADMLNNSPACTKLKCQEHHCIKNFSNTNYIKL
jgi:hypothetical protein